MSIRSSRILCLRVERSVPSACPTMVRTVAKLRLVSSAMSRSEMPPLRSLRTVAHCVSLAAAEGDELIRLRRENKQLRLERDILSPGRQCLRVVMQEGPPSLAGRPQPFDHVLGDARLRDFKPELEQFAVNAWRAQSGFSALIRRINTRSSVSICGRPPGARDFQRQ